MKKLAIFLKPTHFGWQKAILNLNRSRFDSMALGGTLSYHPWFHLKANMTQRS